MPGDVVTGRVNWALLRELNAAPPDVKHFAGTVRCMECGYEEQLVVAAPLWAMHPPSLACAVQNPDGECEGLLIFIHPDDPARNGAASYDYFVVMPDGRSGFDRPHREKDRDPL